MFLGPLWSRRKGEEDLLKTRKYIPHVLILLSHQKKGLETPMLQIVVLEKTEKIKCVSILKGPVDKFSKDPSVFFFVINYKIVGGVIHQVEEFSRLVNDGLALSPTQNGGPESGNLNVLLAGKPMGNADRVIVNKSRFVVMTGIMVKQVFYLFESRLQKGN